MDLHLPKMLTQSLLLLRRNILISKENHTPLRNQQSQLILLLIRQILQLQTHNLRPDILCQMDDLLSCP
jgi:hypothetical protein